MVNTSFINVCCLQNKVDEVDAFLSKNSIQILGVAETWLKPSITNGEVTIPNYKLYRKDRTSQEGGGVGIYYHNTLQVHRRPDLENELELIWLEIVDQGYRTLLGCGYRPPEKPVIYRTALNGQQDSTVLMGDFNVDYRNPSAPNARHLHNILTSLNLQNFVTSSTRITSTSSSMIDLLLSNNKIEGVCQIIPVDTSDHHAILANLPSQRSNIARNRSHLPCRLTRQLFRIDWDRFNIALSEKLPSPTLFDNGSRNIDMAVEAFTSAIISTLDIHAPLSKRCKRGRRPCPWLTPELVAAVRQRNQLYRRLPKNRKNTELCTLHRAAREAVRALDPRLRNAFFVKECETKDHRKLWSVMNSVTGRKKQSEPPKASLKCLCDSFGAIVSDPSRPERLRPTQGPMPQGTFDVFKPVSVNNVCVMLQTVNPVKATGSDGIPG